jgi:hypothetical protein
MHDEEYLTPKEAAAYIGSTENSLRSMRSTGIGPKVTRPNGWRPRYAKADLDEYLAGRAQTHVAHAEAAARRRLEKERGLTGDESVRPRLV